MKPLALALALLLGACGRYCHGQCAWEQPDYVANTLFPHWHEYGPPISDYYQYPLGAPDTVNVCIGYYC